MFVAINLKWFNFPTLWVGKKIKVPLLKGGSELSELGDDVLRFILPRSWF